MILGNSLKQNTGKKYITKNTTKEVTPENQLKADSFKEWFGDNYNLLVEEQRRKQTLNEDVLIDTFFKLYHKQQQQGNIEDYKSYFCRAYFTNYFQNNIKEEKKKQNHIYLNLIDKEYEDSFNTLDIIPLEDADDKERELEKLNKTDKLLTDTFQYITDKYSMQQFELFRMYMFLKPHISYKKLSDITNLSIKYISQTISTIKKDIQDNQELISKRKKLIYN
ncbi:hypothetical protein [Bacteroides fragilis]|uniref:Sigma-70 family RNA polymerase sigma factor n=1 Tax=Bacteroides fragilis TaxID=817 RepID=A0A853PU09_BACFG|nr:hypothetical protein [Bacteroides fragilis]EYA39798.1 hypothetical protein M075_1670 [Bacteroides fragilis str. 20793-3]MCS2358832.1 hypothetical protein [Bacteroides fragilis]OCR30602.1 hypothetical protein AC094_29510 [Bacteroides fragilis]PJY66303.1 hypothetical protein CQW35_01624 [Bacteroides fragilis]